LSFVIDSSVAVSWCFEDEQTSAVLDLLDQVVEGGAIAPALWPLEVLNALFTAERRKRLDAAQRHRLAGFLRDLPITIDSETDSQAWTATMRLAEAHRLTMYDAAYLELAQRLAVPLAALDQELCGAAKAEGVPLVELKT
jgi:predicted nucleic acid-binding protein